MPSYQTKILDFRVEVCPQCGKLHEYKLKTFVKEAAAGNILLFGGPGDRSEVMFTCSNTGKMFTQYVSVPENTEVAGVATTEDIAAYKTEPAMQGSLPEELKEWIKTSRSTALDFCKSMLSTSLGAIPVYFAILKYIGSEKMDASRKFFVMPPVLFLLAATLYVLALKPNFGSLRQEDFDAFKNKRLTQLNMYLFTGTLIFIIGTFSSILIFLSSL